jgi:hypothetical protein
MSARGTKLSEASREAVSRGVSYKARRRLHAARSIAPKEIRALERTGALSWRLRDFCAAAHAEGEEIAEALGGYDALTPQVRAVLRDLVRLGTLTSALLARALQREPEDLDLEVVQRVGALVNGRRQLFALLGLERLERPLTVASVVQEIEADRSDTDPR